jgi:hypothetical protein
MSAQNAPRPGRRSKPGAPVPAFNGTAKELSEYIALMGVERVAAALRVRVTDLEPLLAGRVRPLSVGLRQLRAMARELGR